MGLKFFAAFAVILSVSINVSASMRIHIDKVHDQSENSVSASGSYSESHADKRQPASVNKTGSDSAKVVLPRSADELKKPALLTGDDESKSYLLNKEL